MNDRNQSADKTDEKTRTKRLVEISQVPHAMRQEAIARWGVDVEFNAAREEGRYKGQVFTSDEYIAQRVGEKSVVIHRKNDIDFSGNENLKVRADEKRLNDTQLHIRYEGAAGKAYFYDPKRDAIETFAHQAKEVAKEKFRDSPAVLKDFMERMDTVQQGMIDRYRAARTKQFEQRTAAGRPQSRPAENKEREALERQ